MHLAPYADTHHSAAAWRRIHASRQPAYDTNLDRWLIAGHDHVRTALTDTHRFSHAGALSPTRPLTAEAAAILAGADIPDVLVGADAPQHTRIRAILRQLWPTTAHGADHAWGDLVSRRVEQLVDGLAEREHVDLVHQFAARLPLLVMSDALGVTAEQGRHLAGPAHGLVDLAGGDLSPQRQQEQAADVVASWHCLRDLIAQHAAAGTGRGLIGALLRYRAGDDARLTETDVAAITFTLIAAGVPATGAALGHALEHGLADPTRWARLAGDEHYLAVHVEEALRHSPAIATALRTTRTDLTIGDATIAAGSRCLLLIGTANHDPTVFTDPELFHPDRARLSQHLSFGAGPHHCLGACLARLQLTTALRTLARRLPHLRIAGSYPRQLTPNAVLYAHATLPATTQASHPAGPAPHPGGTQ